MTKSKFFISILSALFSCINFALADVAARVKITPEQAIKNAQIAKNIEFYYGNQKFEVPWFWIQENCTRRANLVNYVLGSEVQSISNSPLETEIHKFIKNQNRSGQIFLSGPLVGRFDMLDANDSIVNTNSYSWSEHVATTVNVNGVIQVIDPSTSFGPLSIQVWISLYIKNSNNCIALNEKDYGETLSYYTKRNQFPSTKKPKNFCGYVLRNSFGLLETIKSSQQVKDELQESKDLLKSNFEAWTGVLNHQNIKSLRTTPMSEKDFCDKVINFKWCQHLN